MTKLVYKLLSFNRMKYLAYLALVGLVESKTALIIDETKIQSTAMDVAMAVQTEATRPESLAVGQALQQEIEVAAIKVDMSMGRIMKPVIKSLENEIEMMGVSEECKVHMYYQCLADQGVAQSPWMDQQSCDTQSGCTTRYRTSTQAEDTIYFDE